MKSVKLLLTITSILFFNYSAWSEDKKLFKADWDFLFNPEDFNKDFSTYDQATSLICCKLSYLSYYRESDIKYAQEQFKRYYPKSEVQIKFFEVDETGTQLIFFGTKDYCVVAFRGTEFSKFKDVRTDAKYFAYKTKPKYNGAWMNMPPGHGGFRRAVKSVIDQKIFQELESFVEQLKSDSNDKIPVYTTGHSLGAGLAIFAIEPLKYNLKGIEYSGTYTFAPPLTLSRSDEHKKEIEKFEAENGEKIHNIVHYRDYVTRAGLSSRSILKHVGNYYRICLNHEIVKNKPVAIRPYKFRRFKLLEYHTIVNILKYIQYASNTNDLIEDRIKNKCLCEEDEKQDYSDDLIID